VRLFGGCTVEVDSTDAEGRLILAEALVTAFQDGVDEVVEVSTLSGAGVLGRYVSGVMGEERLVAQVLSAAAEAGERLWPLPLPRDVREGLRSRAADLHQVLPGQEWDSPMIQGGAFLSHFVPERRAWVHIDIGGQVARPRGGATTATGVPVRTLIRLLLIRNAQTGHRGDAWHGGG
jgi:leucyl aminopeptidase